jgi:hypothetical protein
MKPFILILALSITFSIEAQTPGQYIDYGLVRVQGNLALGKPLRTAGTNMYWVADLDVYCRDNISISSGAFYSFGSFGGPKLFKENHCAYLGATYHFKTDGHFDPFIGILPGFSVARLNKNSIVFSDTAKPQSSYPLSFNPLFMVSAGVTYYANRFFNVFIHAKYQTGKHFSDVAPVSLEELKISFGLGYMIWARKKYFHFRKPNDTSQ